MQLLAALGALLIYTKGPGPEADAALTRALRIAEALESTDYQVRSLWGLWSSQFNSGNITRSLSTAEKLREVAANSGDAAAALVGERSVGMSLFYLGDHFNARRSTESMLNKYVRPEDRSHIVRFQFDPRLVSLTLLTKILWSQGFPDQAMRNVNSVVEEALAVDHAMSVTLALAQAACPVTLLCGDSVAAERFITLLLKHSAEHGLDAWHAWGRCFAAELLIVQGNVDEGVKALQNVLDGLTQGSFFMHNAPLRATLASALGTSGQISRGLAIIDEALARAERDEERWYMAEFLRVRGELLQLEKTSTSTKEAEDQFQQSLDWARRQQALSWELRTSISLARLYQGQRRIAAAYDVLAPVYGRFEEGFRTADLRLAKTLISKLSEPDGGPSAG
jgi:predicted ATPase